MYLAFSPIMGRLMTWIKRLGHRRDRIGPRCALHGIDARYELGRSDLPEQLVARLPMRYQVGRTAAAGQPRVLLKEPA